MDHKLSPHAVFHEKLNQLLEQAQRLINDAKAKKPYNEGLVCLLSNTIYELEDASNKVVHHNHHEELVIDAKLVKNILEQPVYPKNEPHKKLSLFQAAKLQKETKSTQEMKEIILACVLDPQATEVMLEDLKDLSRSVDQELNSP